MRSREVGRVPGGERKDRPIGKIANRLLRFLFLILFLYSVSRLMGYYLEYQRQERMRDEAVKNYIREAPAAEDSAKNQAERPLSEAAGNRAARSIRKASAEEQAETAGGKDARCPITVDFDALLAENEDIAGWIYCEGTNINYPVVQGKDNDYYLTHSYDRKASNAGAIFVDAGNRPQFADSNTILYGHHMKNGGMFAHLGDFSDQEFFDAHPVMWLLTPEQTYRVELFGGYLTKAGSDSYTIFTGECEEFNDYLERALAASDVQAETQTPPDGRYIMLSTCEYDFEDARYVLHGHLVKTE